MSRRVTLWVLVVVVLVPAGVSLARSDIPPVSKTSLVSIFLPTHRDLVRYERTAIPAYARLHGHEGDYLITGVDPVALHKLTGANLSVQVLDADTTGNTYYLAHSALDRPHFDWGAYGHLLLDGGAQVLLRLSPQEAEELAATDTEVGLTPLPLTPKPLRPSLAPGAIPVLVDPHPLVQSMISQVVSTTVLQYTGDLSGKWPVEVDDEPYTIVGRYTYSGLPIWKATNLVEEHLAALGLEVERQIWGSVTSPNIIGELRGEINPHDIFIIGAHLDDAPFGYAAPGADDNASGCTAVLIAADILSQYRWGSTLRFVFWTGEEQWSLEEPYAHGSRPYARRSREMDENIVGVLNLDMLGWNTPGSDPDIDLEATVNLSPTLQVAQLFADVIHTYNLDLIPHIRSDAAGEGDYGSFWDYGYPAIMAIEFYGDFNPHYHTVSDKLEYLDIAYFTEFVRASVGTFAHMCDCIVSRGKVYVPIILR